MARSVDPAPPAGSSLGAGAKESVAFAIVTWIRLRTATFATWVVDHRLIAGAALFAIASTLPLFDAIVEKQRYWAPVALLAVPAAYLLRRRERLAALALVAGGITLRLAVAWAWQADPMAVSMTAGQAALQGLNPYGHGYAESVPPGAPYPYGPLALVWFLPGQAVEAAASVATMLLLVATGSWLTLGLYAGDDMAVQAATVGTNDISPGLLIALAFLIMRRRPILGGVVLAAAAALKEYAFAWFPAAIGYAGPAVLVGLVGATAVLWSPLLTWGFDSYLKSVELARSVHPWPNALDMPDVRYAGVPIALAGLWARRLELAVVIGALAFVIVLFFDRWASKVYLLAFLPIVGIALEAWFVRRAGRPAEGR